MEAALLSRAAQSGGGLNQGRHRNAGGSSVSALLSTLIPIFLLTSALFLVFLMLRNRLPRVYQPRTYLGSLRSWQRSPEQNPGFLAWIREYAGLRDEFIMGHASLDNYLWVRFIRMLSVMCFVGCIITWPVLFPVNATGGGGADGLDILSFSNINPGPRYWAQVFISWLFLAFGMFMITRESRFFVKLRQHYYLSPGQGSLISSRTVLFTNVPVEKRSPDAVRQEFANAKSIWFMDVSDELAEQVKARDDAAHRLERAEIKLAQKYTKRQRKAAEEEKQTEDINVLADDRPTYRLEKWKLPIGKKVDTIDWSRGELRRLIQDVQQARQDKSALQGACFVEFESVRAAYAAIHACGVKNKMSLTPKEYAPSPDTVIWENITKPFWKVQAMNIAATVFVVLLCLFWSIPVAVIGAISNINYLTSEVPFLSFIDNVPDVILGVITGLLPVLLLAILMALIPVLLAFLARRFEPTMGSVQMKVQSWYFPFQVIQVFLITTFSSGAASVAAQIVQEPTSAVSLLAKNLPKASNFYISYFILFGLLSAVLQIMNVVPLLMLSLVGKILDKTPRKMYDRYSNLAGLGWGPSYAKFANLGVIALSYSCIAPLVLGFGGIGFFILYLAFRYNMFFTLGTQVSTRGNSYACAMQQLTVGIYLSELCLIGLFAIGTASTVQSIGPLVLEVVLLLATIIWHVWLNRHLAKLESDIPEISKSDSHGHGDLEKASRSHQQGLVGRIQGFFHPDVAAYNASWLVSSTLHKHEVSYTGEEHELAYAHPAAVSDCPQIWIAKDSYGLSKEEIEKTKKETDVQITDEAAWIDERGKLRWTEDVRSSPIWEEPVRY